MIFHRFKVLILSHPNEIAFRRCLASVRAQSVDPVDVCIVDRGLENRNVLEPYANSWKILSPTKTEPVTEILEGMAELAPDNEDITLILEGSDELYNRDVLGRIHNAYLRYDILFTYSQYLLYATGRVGKNCLPTPKLVSRRSYRRKRWPCYGLRTFKGTLFHNLSPHDISEEALEPSLFYPMLEMAGPRIHFLPEIQLLVQDDPAQKFAPFPREILKKSAYPVI